MLSFKKQVRLMLSIRRDQQGPIRHICDVFAMYVGGRRGGGGYHTTQSDVVEIIGGCVQSVNTHAWVACSGIQLPFECSLCLHTGYFNVIVLKCSSETQGMNPSVHCYAGRVQELRMTTLYEI